MAARKSRSHLRARSNSSPLSRRNRTRKIHTIVEEIGDGDEAVAPAPSTPTQMLKRSFALGCITSFLPSPSKSPQSQSSTPAKSETKIEDLEEDSDTQTPHVPAKLAKHDRGVPKRKPPPPPYNSQPRSSSAPRQEDPSKRLRKAKSPIRPPPRTDPNTTSDPSRRERSSSLAPPIPPSSQNGRQGGLISSPGNSRPTSSHSDQEANKSGRISKRKSWLGLGSRSKNPSQDTSTSHLLKAWIVKDGSTYDYNVSLLTDGQMIPEMNAQSGDTHVYLFPRESQRRSQFYLHSPVIASSKILYGLLTDIAPPLTGRQRTRSFDGRRNLAIEDAMRDLNYNAQAAPPQLRNLPNDNQSTSDGSNESIRSLQEGPREYNLYFPIKLSSTGPEFSARDTQRLIDVRNLFAVLEGQDLVRTKETPTLFHILMAVASLFQEFEFTNVDGSTYGESATAALDFLFVFEKLGDVSQSREKTIEGIILGERLRSVELYNEAFAHAVGKYEAVKTVNPSLYSQISLDTRNRLDRAYLDLRQRQRAADVRLADFEYPSIFAGIAASTSSEESKIVRFKAWKTNFLSLRRAVLSYYKDLHGQWPPKASSKKNNFVEGGLNRLVLKGLYDDFCGLYELLADRKDFTTRSFNASDDQETANVTPTSALRRLLGEFDQSSPPVAPPIPYDVPLIPSMATTNPGLHSMGPKEQNMLANKKLKDHENQLIIAKSHNQVNTNHDGQRKQFLDMFSAFEAKEARSKTCSQLADMRYGHWIFMYAVLQSLPMLVVDAPGLRYTSGVEYFLCEPSMGNPPWMEDAGVKREWYGVANSGHAVILPSDLVNHGVEGIYRRSFCWVKADQWLGENDHPHDHTLEATDIDRSTSLSPLQPPPSFFSGKPGARAVSRGRDAASVHSENHESRSRSRQSQRNSIGIGLEKLPIPFHSGSESPSSASASRGQSPAGMNLYDNSGRRVSASGPPTRAPGAEDYKAPTFDDILGTVTTQKEGGRGKGVWGFK